MFYLGFLGEIYFYLGDAWKGCVIQGPPAYGTIYIVYNKKGIFLRDF